MNRNFAVFLFLFCVLFSIESNAQKPTKADADLSADVESVSFDQKTVYLPCPPVTTRSVYAQCQEGDLKVKVATVATNAGKNDLTYYYLVTGGRIIGEGANVIWDFSKTRLGKYSITVGVGSGGVIRGKILTKTIDLEECPHCPSECECPELSLFAPTETVKAGDAFIVSSSVGGFDDEDIIYTWKVSGGTIVSGQGTPKILVKSNSTDKDVKITLELGLCEACTDNSRSVNVSIRKN